MSFAVFTGGGGYAGWRVLTGTADQQKAIIAREPEIARATAHFRQGIGNIGQAEDLVRDYRMLSVALKAHGLEDDIGNRHFIRKILESDLSDPKSLANRLQDARYKDLAHSFGFADKDATHRANPEFAARISTAYLQAEFEARVGHSDNDMRIALYARRELAAIADSTASEATKWYQVVGSPPLGQFMQTTLGFGKTLGQMPVDSQVTALKTALKRQLGITDVAQLGEPARMERAIGLFLARAQIDGGGAADRFSTALTLLR